jgi:hypothetical protein
MVSSNQEVSMKIELEDGRLKLCEECPDDQRILEHIARAGRLHVIGMQTSSKEKSGGVNAVVLQLSSH